jgi:hypothetical protein
MGGMKVGSVLLPYTAAGTTAATDHPASNVGLARYWRRTWRTTAVGGSLTLTFPSAKIPKAVYLNGANFPTATILGSGVTVAQDTRVARRRHGWFDFPANATSASTLVITPGGTPDGGAGYYELGAVAVFDTVVELSDSPDFPRWTPRQGRTVTTFPSQGREVNTEGPIYLEWTIGNEDFPRAAIVDELLDLIGAGSGPVVIWENRGPTQHAYLFDRLDDPSVQEKVVTIATELTFVEAL